MWTPNHFTKPVGPHDGTPTLEAPRPKSPDISSGRKATDSLLLPSPT